MPFSSVSIQPSPAVVGRRQQPTEFQNLQRAHPNITAGTTAADWTRHPKHHCWMQIGPREKQMGTRVSDSADIDSESIVYGKGVVTGLTKVRNSLIGGEVTDSAQAHNSHVLPGGVLTGRICAVKARVNRSDTPRESRDP